jgi:hypothetical protein
MLERRLMARNSRWWGLPRPELGGLHLSVDRESTRLVDGPCAQVIPLEFNDVC